MTPTYECEENIMGTLFKSAIVLLAVTLTGCATIEPKPGFGDVSLQVSERTGKKIHWRKGGPEDDEVIAEIRRMLQDELTVEEAVQIALLANPELQATYEELGIAQADLVQAGLLRNPIFEAGVLYPRGESGKNLDFNIAWDFLGVFTLPLRKRAAENEFELAKLKVTAEVLDRAGEVRSAFYQAQANSQFVEMMQQVVRATTAALHASKQLRAAGNISELALDQQNALHQESRLMLASAEAATVDSRERLNALMGLWGTATQWRMADRLPTVPDTPQDLAGIEKRAIERSLDLGMLRLRMAVLAKRAGIKNLTSIIDDLEIGYTWERDDGEWEDGPSISFPIPIFDFGQAKRARARAELDQARAQYKANAIQVRSAARAASRRLELARMRERHLKEVMLPLRERISYGMQLEYNAMQVGVFRLLRTQEQQLVTGQQYIEALRDFWLARAGTEMIVNGRMGGMSGMASMMAAPAMAGAAEGGH
jgi:cobalt-zinc-cadmium efflux system outer membrane protein